MVTLTNSASCVVKMAKATDEIFMCLSTNRRDAAVLKRCIDEHVLENESFGIPTAKSRLGDRERSSMCFLGDKCSNCCV